MRQYEYYRALDTSFLPSPLLQAVYVDTCLFTLL
jgi:hypothetical protein